MKRITTLMLIFCFVAGYAQSGDEFTPSGSAYAKIFFNYHSDFSDESAFEVERGYFGYKYKLTKEFSANILLDVGSQKLTVVDSSGLKLDASSNTELTAFLKNANISYKKGNLTLDIGVIGLQQVSVSEKHWGHRYIYKAFQDAAGMAHTADLGIMAAYKFGDMFSADLTLRNGEGYKTLSVDNNLLTSLGLTLTPVKGLTVRAFYDYLSKNDVAKITLSHFVGYSNKKITIGAEHNIQLNNGNTENHDLNGFSVAASYNINDSFELFGRFDHIGSNTLATETDPWNLSKNGNYLIAGLQYSPIKNIQFALNYRGDMPADDAEDMGHAAYLNCQFAF
ncbi:MAG: hypothetical protein JW801_13880 [Bacteroidales bacterium]|nr:hypothetical protein [Bacteroidales bacterium]